MDKKMAWFIVKRLLLAFVTVFVVITITFFAMNAIPGGPFLSEKAKSPEVIKRLTELYGLDKPLFIQYLNYLKNSLVWNFGYSIKSNGALTVNEIIGRGMIYSAPVGLAAAFLAIIIGIVLGTIAAYKHNSAADRTIMVASTACVAMPSFVIATILLFIFVTTLHWVAPNGDNWTGYILPVITLALYPTAYITRLTRSSTLDVLDADYIRTAHAKGLSNTKVLFKHSLRNSLTPVITYSGPMVAFIITGSLVVEQIFGIKGLGGDFVSSITNRDYPVVMGLTIFLTYLVVIMVLVSDILYKVVNPRVKLD